MKYIKTIELVDYKKINYFDDIKEHSGPVYLYTDIPVDKDEIENGRYRIYLYNRADASDTESEYIYQIKLKKPLYKKEGNGFFGFFDWEDNDKIDLSKYSGYFYKSITDELLVKITNPEDILNFKLIGGFVKYDKSKTDRKNIKLSEKTNDWLYSYISGSMRVPAITQDIIDELKQFKNTEPIKIYKGIEEVQIKHHSEIAPPYKKGQIITSEFNFPTSWSTNILIARRFVDDYPSSTPYVISMIVDPKDILVNVQMLPKQYYHTNQREITLLPGKYTYKIIWEG